MTPPILSSTQSRDSPPSFTYVTLVQRPTLPDFSPFRPTIPSLAASGDGSTRMTRTTTYNITLLSQRNETFYKPTTWTTWNTNVPATTTVSPTQALHKPPLTATHHNGS